MDLRLDLSDHHDVDARIKKAFKAFGALRDHLFSTHDVFERLKGKIYSGGVLAVLLYGCKSWCLTAESISRLCNWHNKRIREMCRVTIFQSIVHQDLQRSYRCARVSSRLSTALQAALYSGLATSHACLRVGYRKGSSFRGHKSRDSRRSRDDLWQTSGMTSKVLLPRGWRRKSGHLFGMGNPGAGPRWLAESRHESTFRH